MMAIRRCPYCKAIIDESLEYCSNCGTQLLFPEDEAIEEDIPGEKIVDGDEEEEKEEKPEPPKKKRLKEKSSEPKKEVTNHEEKKEKAESIADELDKLLEPLEKKPKKAEEETEKPEPVPETGEEIPTDELSIDKAIERELGKPPLVTPPTSPDFIEKAEGIMPRTTPGEKEEFEGLAEGEVKSPPKPKKPKEEEPPPKQLTFATDELEQAINTTEKEKEEIERFLDSIKREREKIAAQEAPVQKEETPLPQPRTDDEEAIPPWASKIKETPPEEMASFQDETREKLIDEDEDLEIGTRKLLEGEAAVQDSGVGLPEDVGQQDIAFDREVDKEERVLRRKPPSRFSKWLKSKAFDVFFIGALWLIALWVASRVMDVSLFRIIAASTLAVLVFFGILLVSYLFLFHLFLGETLGDHLFFQD